MAEMHCMEPGRLDQILKKKGKTRADIQTVPAGYAANSKPEKTNDNTLDKKTVIKMNKGEPVSIGVLKKLAARLEIDIEELVPDLSKTSDDEWWSEDPPWTFEFDFMFNDNCHPFGEMQSLDQWDATKQDQAELKLHKVAKLESSVILRSKGKEVVKLEASEILRMAVQSASKIRYKLGVSRLSSDQENALTEFSEVISQLRDLKHKKPPDTDLLSQIEAVKTKSAPLAILDDLKGSGLHVYLLRYLKYQRNERSHDAEVLGWEYSKKEILAIGIINHEPENGVEFYLDIGTKIRMVPSEISRNLDYVFGDFDFCFVENVPVARAAYSKPNESTNQSTSEVNKRVAEDHVNQTDSSSSGDLNKPP